MQDPRDGIVRRGDEEWAQERRRMLSSVNRVLKDRIAFVLFLMVGGFAAGVNIVSRILLNFVMPYEAAIVPAYLCGMTTAYLLNKAFVFEPSGRSGSHEYLRFALVNLLAIAQVWVISVGLYRLVFPAISWRWHPETVAHIIGLGVPAFTSYLGHKYFTFAAVYSKPDG
jgi:putative flippase GtrA